MVGLGMGLKSFILRFEGLRMGINSYQWDWEWDLSPVQRIGNGT